MAQRAVLMSAALIGWDVGGAHLKAAAVSSTGELLRVWSIPCPLWQGLDQLESAVSQIEAELALAQCCHALTMTGEMCDLFPTRDMGVSGITHWFQRRLGGAPLRVYAADAGLLSCDAVDARAVASMNWHATASAVARACPDALLIDVGSTTTDLIRLQAGEIVMAGRDDRSRLASDELVYQGVVRTPVMALTQRAPYAGVWQGLAAEYFATTADVHRLCGTLPDEVDLQPSADGRGKSRAESAARLARMVGDDATTSNHADLIALAEHLAGLQRSHLMAAVERVEALRQGTRSVVVGAGIGRFLTRQMAAEQGFPYLDFAAALGLPEALRGVASDHAPAVAVALAGHQHAWD